MSGRIRVERDGHVATIIIDNPAKRNALNQAMLVALADALQGLTQEPDLRCVVLKGEGTGAFASGADIDEFEASRSTKEKGIAFAQHGHRAMHAIRECPIPTVAAIRGACVGGGLELAAGCDIRIASDDARFGVPIARLGAVLAYPELENLVHLAGPKVALELLLEGRVLSAAEAFSKGLLTRVVATGQFDTELAATLERVTAGGPLSAKWHKKFVQRLEQGTPLTEVERQEGYACYDTEDFAEGWRSFVGRRPPQFKGR